MGGKSIAVAVLMFVFMGIEFPVVNNLPDASARPKNDKLLVVASFYPLYFFSSAIGGDKAEVVNVTPPGVEPHDYEPTASDIARIEDSKLVVLNGAGLESWGGSIQKNIDAVHTLLVNAAEGLATRQVVEDGKNIIDPHVWLSPVLAKKMVDNIIGGFLRVDPANAAYYRSNAAALKAKLDRLDEAFRAGLKNCKGKDIVTSHAAFGYIATAYGFNQVPITGLSPDAEPSPRQMADIVAYIKARNVKYIFFESLVSPKLSQTIANEIGAKTLALNPIEGLAAEETASGRDYFSIMQTNLDNLRTALQCAK